MASPVNQATESATVTIASGQSLSPAVNLGGRKLCGIAMPAAWTAAGLTLQGSVDGTTYLDVYIAAGTAYTITAAASQMIVLDPNLLRAMSYLKVRSGTAGAPVNQGADRALTLLLAASV